jgi:hypothetical protein
MLKNLGIVIKPISISNIWLAIEIQREISFRVSIVGALFDMDIYSSNNNREKKV